MLKISQNIRNRHIFATLRRNFSTTMSSLEMTHTRDYEFLKKVYTTDEYSIEDFSNFIRVLNKHGANEKMLERFTSELPKHLNYLDYLDTRKAISVLLANPQLYKNTELVNSLKQRFREVRNLKEFSSDKESIRVGCNMRNQPLAVRFWVGYARFRERCYMSARIIGLNLK